MPTYEMPVLIRLGSKAEYLTILKGVANSIFETGGFIRKIENWGAKELPYKAVAHNTTYSKAAHFFFCFDCPPSEVQRIKDDYKRNLDVVKAKIYKYNDPEESEETQCTFEEEMLPPPYRPSVMKIIEMGEKQKRKRQKFKANNSLGYYPFTK